MTKVRGIFRGLHMGITPITTQNQTTGGKFRPFQQPLRFSDSALRDPAAALMNPALAYQPNLQPTPVSEMLADPITRKKYDIPTAFDEKLLRLGPLEKMREGAKKTFVTMPKTVYQGLKGDSHFSFTDYLDVTSIPYYTGGAVLALNFLAGGDKVGAARQAAGVAMYYLGVLAANKGIDGFYKAKTGVDLNLKFRKANGDVEKVLASTNFPRFDLLEDRDYRPMMRRLGIPDDVADPKREVQEQVRGIISASRADKLILGNILAAVGAGYLARNDGWGNAFKDWHRLGQIWNVGNKLEGSLLTRTTATGQFLIGKLGEPFRAAFVPAARKTTYGVLGVATTLTGMIMGHSWIASRRHRKSFESPFITNLSPALAPEQSPTTAAIQQQLPGGHVNKLPRKGVFEIAQRMENPHNQPFLAPPAQGGQFR